MSRMSGPKRVKIYSQLVQRDGERCFIGLEPATVKPLVVDHWDNDNSNNHLSNLHLICKPMNAVKNPRGGGHRHKILSSMCVRHEIRDGILRPENVIIQSAEFLKNLKSKPLFRHWLFYNIVRCYQLDVDEVVRSGAELADVCPETIKRYLERLTSEVGMYRYKVDEQTGSQLITLKPKWETFRKENEKKALLERQASNWRDDMLKGLKNQIEVDEKIHNEEGVDEKKLSDE